MKINTSENGHVEDFGLGPLCLPFWSDMDYGFQLGPKLPPNRSKLGLSCAILGPSWAEVGAKWVQVGPKLGPCWPKLGPSGAGVAATSDRNGAFGRFCTDVQNVRITTVRISFLAPSRSSWRCTSEQRIVRIDQLFGAGNFFAWPAWRIVLRRIVFQVGKRSKISFETKQPARDPPHHSFEMLLRDLRGQGCRS